MRYVLFCVWLSGLATSTGSRVVCLVWAIPSHGVAFRREDTAIWVVSSLGCCADRAAMSILVYDFWETYGHVYVGSIPSGELLSHRLCQGPVLAFSSKIIGNSPARFWFI